MQEQFYRACLLRGIACRGVKTFRAALKWKRRWWWCFCFQFKAFKVFGVYLKKFKSSDWFKLTSGSGNISEKVYKFHSFGSGLIDFRRFSACCWMKWCALDRMGRKWTKLLLLRPFIFEKKQLFVSFPPQFNLIPPFKNDVFSSTWTSPFPVWMPIAARPSLSSEMSTFPSLLVSSLANSSSYVFVESFSSHRESVKISFLTTEYIVGF